MSLRLSNIRKHLQIIYRTRVAEKSRQTAYVNCYQVSLYSEGFTHHMIQDTSTIVASLKALKKRMSSSPSAPSFLKATPNTMANSTKPRMFIPSASVPTGTCNQTYLVLDISVIQGAFFHKHHYEICCQVTKMIIVMYVEILIVKRNHTVNVI